MTRDEDPTRAARGGTIRGWRALVVLACATLVPIGAAAALWAITATTAPLPGLTGCQYVREREAQIGCYTDRFEDMVSEDGLAAALTAVDRASSDSTTLAADCHLAWHPVGEERGRAAAAGGDRFDNIDAATTCQQGYAHGYTIGFLDATDPTTEELVEIVRSDCGASAGLSALFNCVHAYGHTIARQHQDDIPAGIETCERIDYGALPGADVEAARPGERPPIIVGAEHQCLYGLYMEYGIIDLGRNVTTLDNCGSATTFEARKACYAYLPGRVGAIEGGLPAAARSCHELAPAGEMRESCVKTFSHALDKVERCSLLVAEAERRDCRYVFSLRNLQEEAQSAVEGDLDDFSTTGRVAAPAGVTAPDAPSLSPNALPARG